MGLLIIRVRRFAKAGHTHRKWNTDSASKKHDPQIGLAVISEIKILSLFLDMLNKYLVTLSLGEAIHCFDWMQPGILA
jgi:hypothetical protein